MATAPVLVPIESRAMRQDAELHRFQRLENVRARQRARRRRQLLLAATLVVALTSAGILRFTAVRRTSLERLGLPSAPAPVEVLKPPAALPATTGSALDSTTAVAPSPIHADGVKRDATQPQRIQVETDGRARPLSDSPGQFVVAPSRNEPGDADAVDPTAAIDWLLKRSRERSH